MKVCLVIALACCAPLAPGWQLRGQTRARSLFRGAGRTGKRRAARGRQRLRPPSTRHDRREADREDRAAGRIDGSRPSASWCGACRTAEVRRLHARWLHHRAWYATTARSSTTARKRSSRYFDDGEHRSQRRRASARPSCRAIQARDRAIQIQRLAATDPVAGNNCANSKNVTGSSLITKARPRLCAARTRHCEDTANESRRETRRGQESGRGPPAWALTASPRRGSIAEVMRREHARRHPHPPGTPRSAAGRNCRSPKND